MQYCKSSFTYYSVDMDYCHYGTALYLYIEQTSAHGEVLNPAWVMTQLYPISHINLTLFTSSLSKKYVLFFSLM